jgi:carbon storage regulator CsrA
MLVLTRKSRESVVVGGSDGFHRLLKVTVLAIKDTNVKLGFEVDEDVPVHPSEVRERISVGAAASHPACSKTMLRSCGARRYQSAQREETFGTGASNQ